MASSRNKAASFDIKSIADIARLYGQQAAEREQHRLGVFNKAFTQAETMDQKVALAVAYLGGGK